MPFRRFRGNIPFNLKISQLTANSFDKHAPLLDRRMSDYRFTPWVRTEIKNMFRAREKLKTAAIKSKSTLLLEAYKQVRNRSNAMNSKLMKQHFTDGIQSC